MPKYDNQSMTRLGKGVTLPNEEVAVLKELLATVTYIS